MITENQLIKIWRKLFRNGKISPKDNFFYLGGHSLMAVKLFSEIEKLTGKSLSPSLLFEAPTIERLTETINKGYIVVSIKENPLFCFHDISGNILIYRHFKKYLNQQVYGLQANHGPHIVSMEAIAAHHIQEIRGIQPHGPYYLTGHCFGGILAYEAAQQLTRQGETIGSLIMLDAYPPVKPQSEKKQKRSIPSRIKGIIWRIKRRLTKSYSSLDMEKLCHRAWWKYRPKPFPGEIILFQSKEDIFQENIIDWYSLIKDRITVEKIDASHLGMMREPGVREVANLINKYYAMEQKRNRQGNARICSIQLSIGFF